VVKGPGFNKDLTQLLPNILTQLGPESLAELRKLADQFASQQAAQKHTEGAEDDDDVPDLVDTETFDEQD
jgi:nascent polypeptide-associated complex subunit beta